MTAVIIEDEIPGAKRLEKLLIEKDFTVLVVLTSVVSALRWFEENNHPDLVFMDIKLRDGNCFRILDSIQIKSKIVFTTAYDEFALKAFNYNAIDYLLKPIDEDDLEVAVSKFKVRLPKKENEMQNLSLDFEQIKKMLSNPFEKNHKKRFTVKIGQHLKVISTDEIECFFSENKGTYLHTFDNRNYLIETTLELLEQELDPAAFYRISRKFIIPLKAIKEIVVYSNSRLKIILPSYKEDEVIVSREKVADFKTWIG